MIELMQAALLAVVQGLTEFLPISSEAHLILVPYLFEWPDQGLVFDVSVHVGTLIAVAAYFYPELRPMVCDWGRHLVGGGETRDSRLAWAVLVATIPVGLVGLAFKWLVEGTLRGPLTIAVATLVFGLLLGWADLRARRQRDEYSLGWGGAFFIGCAQVLALIPGTSRSGITMTAGLMLGLSRSAAARFSFLLSIPVIALAGGLNAFELLGTDAPVAWDALLLGTTLATLSAYACIHFFLRFIERVSMLPFVIYRLFLGVFLLYLYG